MSFNHEGEPVASTEEFEAWVADDFAALRKRYIRRVGNFRRKIYEGVEASGQGGLGVVFLLQHYEHPTELSAVIERRWPGLRYVIITINLVGEFAITSTTQEPAGASGSTEVAASGSVGLCEAGGSIASEEGLFTQTYLTSEGAWVDPRYRWARGLAPSGQDECSRLPVPSHPPDVEWRCGGSQASVSIDENAMETRCSRCRFHQRAKRCGRCPSLAAEAPEKRWCFYNVTLPHPELSWIETTQVAAE